MEQLLTVAEVAAWLRCSLVTIYRRVEQGQIPHIKTGRTVRFDRRDIERFLSEHTVEAKK